MDGRIGILERIQIAMTVVSAKWPQARIRQDEEVFVVEDAAGISIAVECTPVLAWEAAARKALVNGSPGVAK